MDEDPTMIAADSGERKAWGWRMRIPFGSAPLRSISCTSSVEAPDLMMQASGSYTAGPASRIW